MEAAAGVGILLGLAEPPPMLWVGVPVVAAFTSRTKALDLVLAALLFVVLTPQPQCCLLFHGDSAVMMGLLHHSRTAR